MIKFKSIPDSDKPRERLIRYGVENLSNEELLAILIKTGSKRNSVKEVATNLLIDTGSISGLREIGINTLTKIDGIGLVKAIELKAAIELGRRVYMNDSNNLVYIKSSSDVYNLLKDDLFNKKQEHFYTIYLDTKQKYIDKRCLFVGTLNNSTVHPREIFKEAYLLSANKIICVHNHPSGDVSPSKQDIVLTRTIKEIGVIHGIELLDHIIIGKDNYFSFNDNNIL